MCINGDPSLPPVDVCLSAEPRVSLCCSHPAALLEMNIVQSSFPGNWSDLPGDLLALIIDKFIFTSSLSDYIRLGAVCRSWRFIFTTVNDEHIELSSHLPMLLFLCQLHIKHDDKRTGSFYSISEKKVYNFQSPVPYHKKKCVGSSHGWLITVDCDKKDHRSFELLNPFRSFNNVITLIPTLSKYVHIGTLKKFVLSADPWPSSSSKPAEDVVVMGIDSFYWLGYCILGDKVWTSVSVPWTSSCRFYYAHDVIYYKSLFYAAMEKGFMVALDIGLHPLQKPPKITLISPNTTHDSLKPGERVEIYLMECSGDLLQVFRVYSGPFQKPTVTTIRFEVYKQYIDDHDSVRRVHVRDLNGFSLILGVNASIFVKSADFPGCKPDCIYFTGGLYLPQDMGVFCLLDESFEAHYPLNANKAVKPTPIWIQPTHISDLIKSITGSCNL